MKPAEGFPNIVTAPPKNKKTATDDNLVNQLVNKNRRMTPDQIFNTVPLRILITALLFFILFTIAFFIADQKNRAEKLEKSKNFTPVAEVKIPKTTATLTPTATTTPAAVKTDCKISGCNSEICSDKDAVSICIARPEYACYKTAVCERQSDGACGWTQTDTLKLCLQQQKK